MYERHRLRGSSAPRKEILDHLGTAQGLEVPGRGATAGVPWLCDAHALAPSAGRSLPAGTVVLAHPRSVTGSGGAALSAQLAEQSMPQRSNPGSACDPVRCFRGMCYHW
eukprot:jgi/Ulvmu1/6402/UM003_0030.1